MSEKPVVQHEKLTTVRIEFRIPRSMESSPEAGLIGVLPKDLDRRETRKKESRSLRDRDLIHSIAYSSGGRNQASDCQTVV
jgi:hypothetical protein